MTKDETLNSQSQNNKIDIKLRFGESHFRSDLFLNYNFLPLDEFNIVVCGGYGDWLFGYIIDYVYPDTDKNAGVHESAIACQWFKPTGECLVNSIPHDNYSFKKAFNTGQLNSISEVNIEFLYDFIDTIIHYIRSTYNVIGCRDIPAMDVMEILKNCIITNGTLDFKYCVDGFLEIYKKRP